ncbi:TrgA family protein [Rhodobacterales bacterium HKCCE3408]|nr:TrgA family protein [Rhodobacterales bacterium HKCCE3408]
MWTAARLVAAVLFTALGYYSATLVAATFPEGTDPKTFVICIASIGLWQGWMTMGKLTGRGYSAAAGNGIRTSVQIAFFGLLLFALVEMFSRSADLRYRDFWTATKDALNLFIEYLGQYAGIPASWGVLLAGGVLIGLATEAAARLWR